MAKRYNARAVKKHHSYTIEEAAEALGAHPQTVRAWTKRGLITLSEKRPTLILGAHLQTFLTESLTVKKRPLLPNELFCLPCGTGVIPDANLADFVEWGRGNGRLTGICPTCEALCHRFANAERLGEVAPDLDIDFRGCEPSLKEHDKAA